MLDTVVWNPVLPSRGDKSLGLKQATDDPWNTITARYAVGQLVKGIVSKVASFGAFVELEEGVDGLVHISQISDDHVEKVRDALDVGQSVEARIVRIDREERRIGLSLKTADLEEGAEFEMPADMPADLRRGENMVGLASAFDEAFSVGGEEWSPGEQQEEKEEE